MTNVVLLRPDESQDPAIQTAQLIQAFAVGRRARGDVFWLGPVDIEDFQIT
ncbi:hypothetical protein [Sulfitobacter sp. 1A15299]|uniref:hypothetical protein n=1 Tax=Sulfitobacter sp. 1A15299 TaxID=3368598 RepID=UPI003745D1D3